MPQPVLASQSSVDRITEIAELIPSLLISTPRTPLVNNQQFREINSGAQYQI